MKELLLLKTIIFPIWISAQIPVTDAATNANLGVSNKQLVNIHLQLKAVNRNLAQLVRLMERTDTNTAESKNILKEELQAKKSAPDYVLQSPDVFRTLELKSKILEVYHSSKSTIGRLDHLESKEKQEFLKLAADAILETNALFKQCREILTTRAIIQPEERLKKVDEINGKLEGILDSLLAFNNKIRRLNAFRDSQRTLIYLNKE